MKNSAAVAKRKKSAAALALSLAATLLLTSLLAGCGKTEPAPVADTPEPAAATEPTAAPEPTATPEPSEEPAASEEPSAEIERQDGERFEAVIVIEGMEETVQYEHVRNGNIGFEMDYEYESLERQSDAVCDRFISIYDDPEEPMNYLEVSNSAEDAEFVAASIRKSLEDDYDIIEETYTLDRAGDCIRLDASGAKDGGGTPDILYTAYIIPADDGCRIAMAQYSFESAEGFGRRFSYMVNTLKVIAITEEYEIPEDNGELPPGWTGADFGELNGIDFEVEPDEDDHEWTGADFGELNGIDFEVEPDGDDHEWTGADFGEQNGN